MKEQWFEAHWDALYERVLSDGRKAADAALRSWAIEDYGDNAEAILGMFYRRVEKDRPWEG